MNANFLYYGIILFALLLTNNAIYSAIYAINIILTLMFITSYQVGGSDICIKSIMEVVYSYLEFMICKYILIFKMLKENVDTIRSALEAAVKGDLGIAVPIDADTSGVPNLIQLITSGVRKIND